MYSVLDYGAMASDSVRMDAYARAIRRAVKPGAVVIDLGAGTGIFALLAARAGARRVHAVDTNPAVYVLRDLARENGFADRIEVHCASSLGLELPEKADVIVSDLRGAFPVHEQHLRLLEDAKRRLLAPGGVLLPQRDELYAALVESDKIARTLDKGALAFSREGFSASTVEQLVRHSSTTDDSRLRSSDVLTSHERWATLEYGQTRGLIEGSVNLEVRRSGRADAIALWFRATVLDDIGFSNEPGTKLAYARTILPLACPTRVTSGGRARVDLRVDELGGRWAWDTRIEDAEGGTSATFRQSTFFGVPTTPEALLRASSQFAPPLSPRAERARAIIELMNGERTVAEIAERARRPGEEADACLADVRGVIAWLGS